MIAMRLARVDEAETLLALWREAGSSPSITDTVEHVAAAIEREGSSVLVAESSDGKVVGSLIATWDGWRGNMYRLAVLPGYRRRGIATALAREGERRLGELGARRLSAVVLLDEAGASEFWQRVGYSHQTEAGRFTKAL